MPVSQLPHCDLGQKVYTGTTSSARVPRASSSTPTGPFASGEYDPIASPTHSPATSGPILLRVPTAILAIVLSPCS